MWRRIFDVRLRRTSLLSFGCVGFLLGVALSQAEWVVPASVSLTGLLLLLACRGRRFIVAVPAVITVGLLLGVSRGDMIIQQLQGYKAHRGQKVELYGEVVQDAIYGSKGQIDVLLQHVRLQGHVMPGQVRVTSFDPLEPKQGDEIAVNGKLYDGFGNYQAAIYYGAIKQTAHNSSWLSASRRHFSAALRNVLPEPEASLGLGFLLGIKSQLPATLNDQLKLVGLTHIVVASGYNLTILVRAARRGWAKHSKYQSTLLAGALMAGFLGITGFSPSMSRAALVTSLSLAAWYYGRIIHPVLLLLLSAAITAAINPLYLWSDVGWYLSFLAFAGVMLGAPLLQKRFFGNKRPPQLAQIGIETLCAELATVPLTLWLFGGVSVVGLAANMLIVPFIPVAMGLSFAAGVGSLLGSGFVWLALPAQWILGYMIALIDWFAAIPWAKASVGLSIGGMITVYAVLLLMSVVLYKKTQYSYLHRNLIE